MGIGDMVSIVIVNWNSGSSLRQCLRSLSGGAGEAEIVVVDNASEDESLDLALADFASCAAIRMERNVGFAAASNIGWRSSQHQPVLFLNPDAEAQAGAVARMAETLRSDPALWALGGQLVDSAGRPQIGFNVRSFPTVAGVAAEMLLLDVLWRKNPWTRKYLMLDWDHRSSRYVDQPAAACLMVKRKALETLNGFDEGFYPAWFEDVDLCRRIAGAGGRIGYEPAARFLHHGGASLQHLPQEKFLEFFHTNQCRYFAKHQGRRAARRIRALVVAGMRLRAAIALVHPFSGSARIESARMYSRTASRLNRLPADLL